MEYIGAIPFVDVAGKGKTLNTVTGQRDAYSVRSGLKRGDGYEFSETITKKEFEGRTADKQVEAYRKTEFARLAKLAAGEKSPAPKGGKK